jgi:hypothetical protein
VIASHYAEPVERRLCAATTLRAAPSAEGKDQGELKSGAAFLMLDDSLGWAWGYAGEKGCVGYVPSEVLAKN